MDKTLEHTDAIGNFVARYARSRDEELSLDEYLAVCKRNPLAYATAAERMLTAIGEPQVLDTRNDPRLSRIFANKLIKIYPAFSEFYGMEEAIEQVVSYFRHAAQGLEERKQMGAAVLVFPTIMNSTPAVEAKAQALLERFSKKHAKTLDKWVKVR